MKKYFSILMAVLILVSLTACSGSASPAPESEPSSEAPVAESQPSEPVSSEAEPSEPEPEASSEVEYEKAEFGALKVVNDLGFTVTGLYVSPTHANTWEENVLSAETLLPSGYSIDVSFPEGENPRYWDLRIVGESKQEVVWYEIDLLTIGTIDLVIADGVITAETYDR